VSDPAPLCSILIANYNGESLLADCIDSVLTQVTQANIEIIVHDDASTDGSVELLRRRYPDVRVLESETNVGFCIANNRMAAAAGGKFLLLINNDAALFPDAIDTLIAKATDIPNERAILGLPQYDWQSGALVDIGWRLDPFLTPVPNLDPARHDIAFVAGSCVLLPRAIWYELEGFPEWFGSIAEDAYLGNVARIAGIPVNCVGSSGYRHHQGSSFGGSRIDEGKLRTRYRRRYLSERNRIAVLVACTPTVLVWPWLLLYLAVMVAEAVALCAFKRDLRPWRDIYRPALRDAWRRHGATLTLRRKVQGRRRIGLREYLRGVAWVPQKWAMVLRHGMPRLGE
jgi:GT2 family glycosyltransferase